MVMHALEMEEEDETESLMHEVNGSPLSPSKNSRNGGAHHRNGKATATTNGAASATTTTSHGRRAKLLFGLGAVAALLIFYWLSPSGGFDGAEGDGSSSATSPNNSNPHEEDTSKTDATTPETPYVPPSSNDDDKQATGAQKDFVYSNFATIVPDPDHPVEKDETRQQEWGQWHFWDGDEGTRPTDDYCAAYPNRDIPGDEFPETAWQVDAVFVNHLLNDAEELVARAMEAIFAEYGHGKPLPPEGLAERMKMFHWDEVDTESDPDNIRPPAKFAGKKGDRGQGGWTTARSLDGLVRRLLHAMMTNDTFTVVLAGHSAAAGHGNHFRQSYIMQMHRIVAPVLARLGVKLITHNLSQGGLGTLQNSLGAGSLYGDEIDLLLWDSGMTERDSEHIDLFLRQGLLGGKRVPVVWGGHFPILMNLHQEADVDVGEWGTAMDGIPVVESEEQAQTLPYAARYLQCDHDHAPICQAAERYCTRCWIDRPDLNPNELFDQIKSKPGGQVKWHPGWRHHQLVGRLLAFALLSALQTAIEIWSDGTMGGPPLDDEWWHVTEYYDNIRTKVRNLPPDVGNCHKIEASLPARVCNTPMRARSFFTPRANPAHTSLSTIIKPAPDGYVPHNEAKMMYEGPDAHNPCFDLPADAVDVVAIVSGRRRERERRWLEEVEEPYLHNRWQSLASSINTTNAATILEKQQEQEQQQNARDLGNDAIVPGKGWEVYGEPPGQCDGEFHSICGRQRGNPCPLYGHHDSRGVVIGNEWAGWLVLELPAVEEGIIILKIVTYMGEEVNKRTKGWTTVNNERRLEEEQQQAEEQIVDESHQQLPPANERRRTKEIDETLPEDFIFDYAIDGKITSLSKAEFLELRKKPQRVMEMLTLLDDPNFTSSARDVEVAFRMRNCGRTCTFALSHVYWA